MPIEKTAKKKEKKLVAKHELFCKLYVSEDFYGNGVQAYRQVYPWCTYDSAKTRSSKLLSDISICQRISELIDVTWLNDQFVDKQLLQLITQNDEKWAKIAAIREYNSIKARKEKALQKALDKWDISSDVIVKLPWS